MVRLDLMVARRYVSFSWLGDDGESEEEDVEEERGREEKVVSWDGDGMGIVRLVAVD